MNLVAGYLRSVCRVPEKAPALLQGFLCRKKRFCMEKAQALFLPAPVVSGRIRKGLSQHLIAPAETEDLPACCRKASNLFRQATPLQPAQVIHGGLRPGQNNEVRLSQVLRPFHIADRRNSGDCQGNEIREIRDMGQADDRDIKKGSSCPFLQLQPLSQGILVVQVNIRIGHDAKKGHPGPLQKHFRPRNQ